jgi:DNA-binding NarL/FixJ family response regulator/transcriptional regulator with XRE-family HTH domain
VPRPERPINPGGPLAGFASGLRALRQRAGLTYRELSRRTHYAPSVLAAAAAGEALPTWQVTVAYVGECGGSIQVWRPRWEELAKQYARRTRRRSLVSSSTGYGHAEAVLARFEHSLGQAPAEGTERGESLARAATKKPHPAPAHGHGPPKRLNMDSIGVLIVDDHQLFRRGLHATLELESDIEVVGEAGDGGDALAKAQELLPDVVLMDVKMPRRGGIEACMAIKQAVPSARIVMLTMSDDEADLYEAVSAGASGYLLKEIPMGELAATIRAVYEGQSLINPSLASKLLTEFATMNKRGTSPQSVPAPRLTNRELEVLRAVARGLNNREIARELFISGNTVKNHIRNILEKLQLHSRMEAVVYAVREKILEIT